MCHVISILLFCLPCPWKKSLDSISLSISSLQRFLFPFSRSLNLPPNTPPDPLCLPCNRPLLFSFPTWSFVLFCFYYPFQYIPLPIFKSMVQKPTDFIKTAWKFLWLFKLNMSKPTHFLHSLLATIPRKEVMSLMLLNGISLLQRETLEWSDFKPSSANSISITIDSIPAVSPLFLSFSLTNIYLFQIIIIHSLLYKSIYVNFSF